jgi:uncharacterized protein (UPF0297 family)
MDKADKNIELPKEKQKTYTAEEFAKGYEELCQKTGYNLMGNPAFVKTNHESYEMVLQFSVGKVGK